MYPFLILTSVLFVLFLVTIRLDILWKGQGAFPFVSFVGGYYLLFHGVLSFYAAYFVQHLPYGRDLEFSTVIFISLFVLLQLAGYWLGMRVVPAGVRRDDAGEPAGAAIAVSWGAIALTFLFFVFPQMNVLPSLPQLRQPCWYFGFAVLVFLTLQGRLSRLHAGIFILVFVAKFVLDTRMGSITPLAVVGVIFVSAAFIAGRYWLAVVCVVLCVLTIGSYGYVKYFSHVIVSSGRANIFQFEPNLSMKSITASVNSMARRSSHSLLTNQVIQDTPLVVPFEDRNLFLDSVINHVPRIFWPGKHKEDRGNSFGKKYGIVDQLDNQTSWNLSWTVDFYLTGGWYRALLNIFLVGFLVAAGMRLMSYFPNRAFGFGLYTATLFQLFYQESNFSLMAGSLGWSIGFLWVSYRVAAYLMRRLGPEPRIGAEGA